MARLWVLAVLLLSGFWVACDEPHVVGATLPETVPAINGVAYTAVVDGGRVEVYVTAQGAVTRRRWTHLSTFRGDVVDEATWVVEPSLVDHLSTTLQGLTGQRFGAIGCLDGKHGFRALRVARGEELPVLSRLPQRCQVVGTLETEIFQRARLSTETRSIDRTVRDVAQAIADCHAHDGSDLRALALLDRERHDYLETVDDSVQKACVTGALAGLRQYVGHPKKRRADDDATVSYAYRVEIRRGDRYVSALSGSVEWPEATGLVGRDEAEPPRLVWPDKAKMPLRGSLAVVFPAEGAHHGRPTELTLQVRQHWESAPTWRKPHLLRGTVRADGTAQVTWQDWNQGVVELSFSTRLTAEQAEDLFAVARGLRLTERDSWRCERKDGYAELVAHSEEPSIDGSSGVAPLHPSIQCRRMRTVEQRMRDWLRLTELDDALRVAMEPVRSAVRECDARAVGDAHATFELAQVGGSPTVATVDHGAGAAGLACAEYTVRRFVPPAELLERAEMTRMKLLVKAHLWDVDLIRSLAHVDHASPDTEPSRW